MPRAFVAGDLTLADDIRGSVAPNTWSSYLAAWRSWVSFAETEGFSYNITSEATILAFLSVLMQQQFSSHYVMKILAGISFFFRLRGLQPCPGYISVRQALKVIGEGSKSWIVEDQYLWTYLGGLCRTTKLVCFSEYEALLFNTTFSFAFFGAFRILELVPTNNRDLSGIWYDQVVVDHLGVHIWLQRSKMDQFGRGCLVNLQAQENVPVCPVASVQHF